MYQKRWMLLLLLIPLIAFTASNARPAAAVAAQDEPVVKIYYYPDGEMPPELESLFTPTAGTSTEIGVQGTGWEMQNSGSMTKTVLPYGTKFRLNSGFPKLQWVHIPVPVPAVVASSVEYLSVVQFCAKTFDYSTAKPLRLQLWNDRQKIYTATLTWPDSTAPQCMLASFYSPNWYSRLGVSVGLNFTNTSTDILMYSAYAIFTD